ncbi:zinc finger C2HC domain-containing protein 1A isoform X1 [Ambystoma mexicanum]|uniref:zinc finger C2HC domain-containing protein 1A isoform X1 n=1 Tax=Ambystoma mexicanum TaxID=8296 RepID=UPI0037E7E5F9
MDTLGEEETLQEKDLIPCKICGRTFFPATLKKHVPICQKTVVKKRKTFDSSRQRAEGTDIPTVKPLKPKPEPPKKQSNWRRKHEEFIATIRAAKGVDKILKVGGELPPPPPPTYDPDYVQCPYCQRRFSENAADRHISFCKEQAARITNKGKLAADTKAKPATRTQYKPPALKKANSVTSVPSTSSRLPQPSQVGRNAGAPTSKVSATNGSPGSKLHTISPARRNSAGGSSPQSGKMEKLGPPLRTGRDAQALHDSETKTDSVIKRPNELLPINKGSMKTRTPPSLARNPASVAAANKRKTYNAENYTRLDGNTGFEFGDFSPSINGGSRKNGKDGNGSGQSKFCHECGTKYPLEFAKFCCECGVRRMVL